MTGFKFKVGNPVTFSYLVLKTKNNEIDKLLLLGFTNKAIKSITDNLLLKNPKIYFDISLDEFFLKEANVKKPPRLMSVAQIGGILLISSLFSS